jgi:2-polyprenyl-6-methoxyphenol hydroxylase-like FAD-dependent oxidoreductase
VGDSTVRTRLLIGADGRRSVVARAVGLAFAVAGAGGYAAGLTWLGAAATAAALVAAFLNAVFGFCLGREMYLLIRRVWPGRRVLAPADADQEVNA